MDFRIEESTIETIVMVSNQIPEFSNPHGAEEYYVRLANKSHLILAASLGDRVVGFKVGYDKDGDRSFYSWMGGVIPELRNSGIAKALAMYQESWARSMGFSTIKFKTRNRHRSMLIFALKNGFNIVEVSPRDTLDEYRIILQKKL